MGNELYHYGRKGMKWYQNIFTKNKRKGGKRDRTDNADESKVDSRSAAYKSARKSVSEMDDSELSSAIQRLRNEQTYKALYSELHPQQVSKGKQFVMTVWDKAVRPAITDAAKDVGVSFVKKQLAKMGIDSKSEYDTLKELADMSRLKKEKAENEKTVASVSDWFKEREKKQKDGESEYDTLKKQYDLEKLKKDIADLGITDTDYESLKKESDIASKKKTIYDSEKARLEYESKLRDEEKRRKKEEEDEDK